MSYENKKVKDRLFCWIFGREENKRNLLSLYNALNGTEYKDESLVEINTLEDIIYMNMKNDVSCIIGDDLSLFEHQSTYNPNMPFREFQYCCKLYEEILVKRDYDLYSTRLLKFPAPHCYVFYNGTKEQEDRELLRLSDAFETPSEGYEWTTTMLNINYGHNKELMNKCEPLMEYSLFVSRIRENQQSMDKTIAVDEAVEYIIGRNGVLSEFFRINKAEVFDMCLTEYDEAKHLRNLKAEGRAEGRAEGEMISALKIYEAMISDGVSSEKAMMYSGFSEETLAQARRIKMKLNQEV
ncbi:MAG: hypothetical protein MJ113_05205 [Lachnospiraceae bacterium]|nr:hypothetical protein [Lachnospiraceae bacterium]